MNGTLIHNMFKDTKADVKKLLNNVHHLALCVDAWSTSTNISYITLRAHVFNPNLDFIITFEVTSLRKFLFTGNAFKVFDSTMSK